MRHILFWSLSFFGALAPWFEAFRAMAELDPSPWEDAGPDGEQPTVTEATKMALRLPGSPGGEEPLWAEPSTCIHFWVFFVKNFRECHRVIGI